MISQSRLLLRFVVLSVISAFLLPPVYATSWGPRTDVGVAAVDSRTGKVLWEAWQPDDVPASDSKNEKTAVEYLIAAGKGTVKSMPEVSLLPDVSVDELKVKVPWPNAEFLFPNSKASRGKNLIYYRHANGVAAFNRQTNQEAWRLLTKRVPYPSLVLEVGEKALIQIGSDVPATLKAVLTNGERRHVRMRNLEPHTIEQRAAAAVLLHEYGDGYLRPQVRKIVEQLREEQADSAAVKSLETLLADWPKTRDRGRLLDGCIAAILYSEEGDPFGRLAWPGNHRALAWCLLQELIYGSPSDGSSRQGYNYAYHVGWKEQPVLLAESTKDKLADHCRKVVIKGPDAEIPFAASVLVSTAVGWDELSDPERKKLFLSANPSAWRWAALALAKNGRRKELMEWASERPAEDHLDVVWVLKHDLPKEWSDAELAFWLKCAGHYPRDMAYVLRACHRPIPTVFREPIRADLLRELAKPTVKRGGTQPAYSLVAAVEVLDAWNNPEDTPLLMDCLKHPVHSIGTRSDGVQSTQIRTYELRTRVRPILERRGVELPAGVVYREEIKPGTE